MNTIIIGMGNPLLTDDSVGLKVAEMLRDHFRGNSEIIVEATSWGGFRVVELMVGYPQAILVDSIKTGIEPYGFIHQFSVQDIENIAHVDASHDLNLASSIKFVRESGLEIPSDISIYAIEVEETSQFSEQCTPMVEEAIESCSRLIIENLNKCL